jgi:hypothetical protein
VLRLHLGGGLMGHQTGTPPQDGDEIETAFRDIDTYLSLDNPFIGESALQGKASRSLGTIRIELERLREERDRLASKHGSVTRLRRRMKNAQLEASEATTRAEDWSMRHANMVRYATEERLRAEQAEAERDRAVKALRGIAERENPTAFDMWDARKIADAALTPPQDTELPPPVKDHPLTIRGDHVLAFWPDAGRCPSCGLTVRVPMSKGSHGCSDPWHEEESP